MIKEKKIYEDFINRYKFKQDKLINDLLFRYIELLIETNNKFNLTSYSDFTDLLDKHIGDSLEIFNIKELFEKVEVDLIDIGSGGGFPAIPIGIFKSDWKITLVESIGKKANFLSETINSLNLKNIKLLHERSEKLAIKPEFKHAFDVVTARGLAKADSLISILSPFLKKDGLMVLWKSLDEINYLEKEIKSYKIIKIHEYFSSNTNRYIVLMKKQN